MYNIVEDIRYKYTIRACMCVLCIYVYSLIRTLFSVNLKFQSVKHECRTAIACQPQSF